MHYCGMAGMEVDAGALYDAKRAGRDRTVLTEPISRGA
jgi:hypothetical protein